MENINMNIDDKKIDEMSDNGKSKYLEGKIKIKGNERFINALGNALNPYKEERFEAKIRKVKETIYINVKAKDATALRAALNSYLRILQALEGF